MKDGNTFCISVPFARLGSVNLQYSNLKTRSIFGVDKLEISAVKYKVSAMCSSSVVSSKN